MTALARRLSADERGATSIEYALIAAMIAFVVILGFTAYAGAANNLFSFITETVLGSLGG